MNIQSINYSTVMYLTRSRKKKHRIRELWKKMFSTKKYVPDVHSAFSVDYVGFDKFLPKLPRNRFVSKSFS